MTTKDVGGPETRHTPAEPVVAVGHAGHITLLLIESGQTLWTCALADNAGASACAGQPVTVGIVGNMVLAGSMGHVFAFQLETGHVLWHKDHRARGSGETQFAFGPAALPPPSRVP